jgi:nucleotide-binding universal stress UspA family protein
MPASSIQSPSPARTPAVHHLPQASDPSSTLHRIVAAVDDSAQSERAFGIALTLAKTTGAVLDIITVVPTYPEYSFGTVAGASAYVPDDESRRYYQEIAARRKERAERAGLAGITVDVLIGRPSTVVLSESEAHRADLVVLGARGVSASHRVLLGSVSNAVATRSSSSVLVVRGTSEEKPKEGAPVFDRVVAAVDGSPSATRALELAIAVCRAFDLPLRVVTVVPISPGVSAALSKKNDAKALGEAQALVEEGRLSATESGVSDVATEVLRGTPSDSILDYLGENLSHLLVVGSRGRTPAQSLFLGSVSTALLHHAPCSVLVAHAPPERGPSGRAKKE